MQSAVEGCLNFARQSVSAGVKRLVVTSSWGTALDVTKMERVYSDYLSTDKGKDGN